MGYTVYWEADKVSPDSALFKVFAEECAKVMEIFDIPKFGEVSVNRGDVNNYVQSSSRCSYEVGENPDYFMLHGTYEDFYFSPMLNNIVASTEENRKFSVFTKTNRHSYDVVVKVLYLVLNKIYGGELSHDGDMADFFIENMENYSLGDLVAAYVAILNLRLYNGEFTISTTLSNQIRRSK
jgi:hypothetical protein